MADAYDERLFLGFVEGDLSPEDTVAFEKQLVENPRLRNLVAQLVLDRHRVRTMPDEEPPAELMEHVNAVLERKMLLDTPGEPQVVATIGAHRRYRTLRIASYAAIAACVLLAVGLFIVPLTDMTLFTRPQTTPLVMQSEKAEAPAEAELGRAAGALAEHTGALKAAPPADESTTAHTEPVAAAQFADASDATEELEQPVAEVLEEAGVADQFARITLAARRLDDGVARGQAEANGPPPPASPISSAPVASKAPAAAEPAPADVEAPRLNVVALAPAAGELELQVIASDQRAARAAVVAWAATNKAQVLTTSAPLAGVDLDEIEKRAAPPVASKAGPAKSSTPAKAAPSPMPDAANATPVVEQVTLVLSARQVPQLVQHLNNLSREKAEQKAQLVVQRDRRALMDTIAATIEPAGGRGQRERNAAMDNADAFRGAQFGVRGVDATAADGDLRYAALAPDRFKLSRVSWSSILGEQLPVQQSIPIDGEDTPVVLPVIIQAEPAE